MSKIYLGRNVYGLAAVTFGVLAFIWRDVNAWREILPLGKFPHPEVLLSIAGAIQLLGGLALQWPSTRRIGAFSLGGLYFLFALLAVPPIVAGPLTYNNWGNFFEQFSLVSGAMVVYGATGPNHPSRSSKLARLGYLSFGICVISFALEQLAYLTPTTTLVPKWLPPGQKFWAIATTIAFGLAAIALLSGRVALLASRLLTVMLVAFGLLVWLPIVVSDPHKLFHWTESAETLAIAGVAWIVADFLTGNRSEPEPAP